MQTIAYTRKTAGVKVLPEVLEYAEKRLLESLPDGYARRTRSHRSASIKHPYGTLDLQ